MEARGHRRERTAPTPVVTTSKSNAYGAAARPGWGCGACWPTGQPSASTAALDVGSARRRPAAACGRPCRRRNSLPNASCSAAESATMLATGAGSPPAPVHGLASWLASPTAMRSRELPFPRITSSVLPSTLGVAQHRDDRPVRESALPHVQSSSSPRRHRETISVPPDRKTELPSPPADALRGESRRGTVGTRNPCSSARGGDRFCQTSRRVPDAQDASDRAVPRPITFARVWIEGTKKYPPPDAVTNWPVASARACCSPPPNSEHRRTLPLAVAF